MKIIITPKSNFSIEDMYSVAEGKTKIEISPSTNKTVMETYEFVINSQRKDKVYGFDTGVADFSTVTIEKNKASEMQINMLKSHSAGVGKPLPKEVVRAIMFSRLITLCKGYSKARPVTLKLLANLLNEDIVPIVPELGSIGCGDLQPLACISLCILGNGKVLYKNKVMDAKKAINKVGLKPLTDITIEALSLIDGNSAVIGLGANLSKEFENIVRLFCVSSALIIEGRQGTIAPMDSHVSKARPFVGQSTVASLLNKLLEGSIIFKTRENFKMLQDPVSIRSTPQVIGTALDTLDSFNEALKIEINSAGDNPVIFIKEKKVVQAANFMSLQLGTLLDSLTKTLSNITTLATASMQIMTNPSYNEGLPQYLTEKAGINSGLMIPVYTAQGINTEIIASTFPRSSLMASVANGWEDISSGSWNSALNLQRVLGLSKHIVALHFLYGMQSIALRAPQMGHGTKQIYSLINKNLKSVFPIKRDLRYDILVTKINNLIFSSEFSDVLKKIIPNFD